MQWNAILTYSLWFMLSLDLFSFFCFNLEICLEVVSRSKAIGSSVFCWWLILDFYSREMIFLRERGKVRIIILWEILCNKKFNGSWLKDSAQSHSLNNKHFIFAELEFLCSADVGDVACLVRWMNLSNQKPVIVHLPTDEQGLAMLRVTGYKSILRDDTAFTRHPIVSWSTDEDFEIGFLMSFVAPCHVKSIFRWNDAA